VTNIETHEGQERMGKCVERRVTCQGGTFRALDGGNRRGITEISGKRAFSLVLREGQGVVSTGSWLGLRHII
jgi:hypothetical protein